MNIVQKALPGVPTCSGTRWFTESLEDFPVKIVTKFSRIPAIYNVILEPITWVQEVMPAQNVEKLLPPAQDLNNTLISTALSIHSGKKCWRFYSSPGCGGDEVGRLEG